MMGHIGYLPTIYPDELLYGWITRYYAYSGHSAYRFVLEELLVSKKHRINMEFSGRLNEQTKDIISKMYPLEELIQYHTMFPQNARFMDSSRIKRALQGIIEGTEDVRRLVVIPANKTVRYLCYCPLCTKEDRERYNETYWHRTHMIRGIGICPKHKCKLKATDIEMSTNKSPKLYVAEEIIPYESDTYSSVEFVEDEKVIAFAKYLSEVFSKPMKMENDVLIKDFLNSRFEGTPYTMITGRQRNISLFYNDFREFYKEMPEFGITELFQLQKVMTGYYTDFYMICQIGFFLGISADDIVNPTLPKVSQTEKFCAEVARLQKQGLGCYKIAKIVGSSPTTALRINRKRVKAEHDYGVCKGIRRCDWDVMDRDMLPIVKQKALEFYSGNGGRPKRVTESAITKALGLPAKRFSYLPMCMEVLQEYKEDYQHYWAREIVWLYKKMQDEKGDKNISGTRLMAAANLRKKDFISCFPYLSLYTDEETAEKIKTLIKW